ncbi:ECF-type sigma factor [Engelhardtia mirabilis]|uniref:ECF sigma factor n=1 Tax=Engelhardtia mirabilis TaxID=2528011 RepID=A0A518BGX8_9BACT|nr:ECF sigma factor [Planctomycetes bacterium Pla133]QDV00564.1 ECF sigma factor [Planctomycetes bacterium Pla86]
MEEPTRLIKRAAGGDLEAYDTLFAILRHDMEAIAGSLMRGESREITLEEGVLLSECYLRLRHLFEQRGESERLPKPDDWQSREHFLRFAARAMRSVLLDNARRRGALKRGRYASPARIDEAAICVHASPDDVIFVDEAIERLSAVDADYGALLELVRFGGLRPREAGVALGLSRKRFEAAWAYIRGWWMRECDQRGKRAHKGTPEGESPE